MSRISDETLERLEAHSWPDNIRELQNVIERSVIMCESEVFSVDEGCLCREAAPEQPPRTPLRLLQFSAPGSRPRESSRSNATLEEIQREAILHALRSVNWMVGGRDGAAAILGLKR